MPLPIRLDPRRAIRLDPCLGTRLTPQATLWLATRLNIQQAPLLAMRLPSVNKDLPEEASSHSDADETLLSQSI